MTKIYFTIIALCVLFAYGTPISAQSTDTPEQIVQEVRQLHAPDRRVAIFEVQPVLHDNNVVLKGSVSSLTAKTDLLQKMNEAAYNVTDSIRVLPDCALPEGKTYGVVNISVCNLHYADDFSSEMQTQALLGMPVHLLDLTNWYRLQTPDQYIAWVHRSAVVPMTVEEYNDWNAAEKVVVTAHYGFTYSEQNELSEPVSDVVSGNRLKLLDESGTYYKVGYPDGRTGYLSKAIAKAEQEWRKEIQVSAQSIIRMSRSLMGIPYLWAGTSAKGVDCSGFVRTVLFLHDIIMPRDASQQAYVGEHIDITPDFENLLPGDLIFFGRKASEERKERVIHIGIYIGNKQFIHSQGDVHISSFDPDHHLFDEFNLNRLLYATRFLDSINTEGINTTLTNPFYLPQ